MAIGKWEYGLDLLDGVYLYVCGQLQEGEIMGWGGAHLDERMRIIYCLKLAGFSLIAVIYKKAPLVVPFKRYKEWPRET